MNVKAPSIPEASLASDASTWKPLIDKSDAVVMAHCRGLPKDAPAKTPVSCRIKEAFKGSLKGDISVLQTYDGQLRMDDVNILFLLVNTSPYTIVSSVTVTERHTKFGKEMRVYDPSGVGSEMYINDKGEYVEDGMSHSLESVVRDLRILSGK